MRAPLFLLMLLPSLAAAQSVTLPGFPPGAFQSRAALDAASGGYVGPGDIRAAKAWWGMRCYSAAYTGNVALIKNHATPATQTTITCSAGGILNETVNPLSTTCATACDISIWYDQSGAASCSGACDASSGTTLPTLTLNAIGSKYCAASAGGVTTFKPGSSITTATQPYSVSGVWNASSTTGGIALGAANSVTDFGFGQDTSILSYRNGGVINVPATIGNWFSVQGMVNGASSDLFVNGSRTAGTLSAGSLDTGPLLFNDPYGNTFIGTVCEVGVFNQMSNADESNMNSNQRSYWGF